jgi:hypothetical protein
VRPSQSPGNQRQRRDVGQSVKFGDDVRNVGPTPPTYPSYLYGTVLNYIIKLRDNILKQPYLTYS